MVAKLSLVMVFFVKKVDAKLMLSMSSSLIFTMSFEKNLASGLLMDPDRPGPHFAGLNRVRIRGQGPLGPAN